MQIYQPLDLVLGALMIPLGLLGLGRDLVRIYRRTLRNRYADWRVLAMSVWFITSGPAKLVEAFAPRHQETPLISDLQSVGLYCAAAILIVYGILWVIRRRRQAWPRIRKVETYY